MWEIAPISGLRSSGVRVGGLLVLLTGVALFAAAFLPWITTDASHVAPGGRGPRTFSGWELATECAERELGRCVLEERRRNRESDYFRDQVVTGDWALAVAALLTVVGAAMVLVRSRGRVLVGLLVAGWVLTLLALVGVVATTYSLAESPNEERLWGEAGPVLMTFVPFVALVGLGLATTAQAWSAAARRGDLPRE